MPSLANTSTELVTLNIHKFPSQAAFNAAVSNNLIGDQDISFINGDTSDVPIPNSGEVGYVLTAGASGAMYWSQGGGGGGGGSTVTVPATTTTIGTSSTHFLSIDGVSEYLQLPTNIPSTWLGTTSNTASAGNHRHGTIDNDGMIVGQNTQTGTSDINNQVKIESGDRLVIGDWSDRVGASYPLKLTTISFGSSTSTYLRNDGVWDTPAGGGGGASTLSGLTDTNIVNASNNDIIVYNASQQAWVNTPIDHDYEMNQSSVSLASSNLSVTFDENTRCYKAYVIASASAALFTPLNLTVDVCNEADNYILIMNENPTVEVEINLITKINGTTKPMIRTDYTAVSGAEYDFLVEPGRGKEYSFVALKNYSNVTSTPQIGRVVVTALPVIDEVIA